MLPGLRKIWDERIETYEPLIGVVREVYQLLTKTNTLVKEKLWRVPPVDLAQSGEVFFMYTCLDYTLTTAYILRRLGISGSLIINELAGKGWPKIHFGVETSHWFIDHVAGNSVIVGTGELPNFYEPLKQEQQVSRHRVDLSQIADSDTVFDIIRKNSLRIWLLSESIVAQLADKFEQDNTMEVWANFIQQSGGNPKEPTIYLQNS
jgi:hypothetical protein